MLDSHVDALLNVAVSDSLVDDDTDSRFCHVVDHAGLAVVDFVGHAFLHSTVCFDVDDVSDSI